jgi:hypothetical protein
MPSANRKLSVKHSILLAVLILYLGILMMSFYKGKRLHVQPGFNIGRSDPHDYDSLSDYILETKSLYPHYSKGKHSSYFFVGFTVLVAVLKGLFRDSWPIAYTLLNGFLIYALAVFASKALSRNRRYLPVFLVFIIFIIGNRYLNIYSRTLLTDYIFSIGAALTFVLLAVGAGKDKRVYLISALIVAIVMTFIRPNGVLLGILTLSILFTRLFSRRLQFRLAIVVPLLVALGVFIFSSGYTSYWAVNFNKLSSLPSSSQNMIREFLRLNYFGDDPLHKSHIGTLIVNFPYTYWSTNDGSWIGIMRSMVKRLPRVFEIPMPVYSNSHNIIRYAYYGTLYLLFLIYAIDSIRRRSQEPEHLLMVVLIISFMVMFISVSQIETRFLLVYDVAFALCSASLIGRTMTVIFSKKQNKSS